MSNDLKHSHHICLQYGKKFDNHIYPIQKIFLINITTKPSIQFSSHTLAHCGYSVLSWHDPTTV
jgi:hypothetical protein